MILIFFFLILRNQVSFVKFFTKNHQQLNQPTINSLYFYPFSSVVNLNLQLFLRRSFALIKSMNTIWIFWSFFVAFRLSLMDKIIDFNLKDSLKNYFYFSMSWWVTLVWELNCGSVFIKTGLKSCLIYFT